MKHPLRTTFPLPAALLAGVFAAAAADLQIPIERHSLNNGMRVVLSRDTTAPVVAVYVIYGVGARSEVKGRSGFAHLFEHMMFQGSTNAPKGMHFKTVESSGGWLNGSTHPDFTDYFEVLPSNKLPVALWLEADRMRGLDISAENLKNQQDAVKEERRLRLDNQPYVTAIVDKWPELAFENWSNEHSIIGSFEDLNAATVEDVRGFFRTYYAPNNAVLVVVGDIDVAQTRAMIDKYFAGIPAQPQPKPPDLTEPSQKQPRYELVKDPLAKVPAVIAGYTGMPERRSPDFYALVMLDVLLTGGDSSRFQQNLVKGKQSVIQYEANLGWPFVGPTDYKAPNPYAAYLVHKPSFTGKQIAAQVEEEVAKIQKQGVAEEELNRAKTYFRASRIKQLQTALNRAQTLAQYEMFDNNPSYVNTEMRHYMSITPKQIQMAAQKYFVPEHRNVIEIVPAPPVSQSAPAGGQKKEGN